MFRADRRVHMQLAATSSKANQTAGLYVATMKFYMQGMTYTINRRVRIDRLRYRVNL